MIKKHRLYRRRNRYTTRHINNRTSKDPEPIFCYCCDPRREMYKLYCDDMCILYYCEKEILELRKTGVDEDICKMIPYSEDIKKVKNSAKKIQT